MRASWVVRGVSLASLVGVLVASGSAVAQDRGIADDLFTQAKALFDAGKYAEACPKFADSQRADPQIGTLLNLALCHDKEGKTASAYAEYKDAAALAAQKGQQDRVDFARKGMADVEPKLSRVTFKIDMPAHGETVKMDDQPVPPTAWGGPFARDPGTHQLEVSAPGKKTWTQEVTIAVGPASADILVPALEDAVVDKGPPVLSANTDKGGSNTKTLGYIVGGVGVAGLAVGGIFGLMYLSKRDESNGVCTASNPKSASGATTCNSTDIAAADELKSSAETLGLVSTIGFIAGAVGVGAGAYFILTSKSPDKTSAATTIRLVPTGGASGRGAGMRLEGSF
jgi:hypothetical protein